jgi:hypothetical protein
MPKTVRIRYEFAGATGVWPVPTNPTPEQIAQAVAACQDHFQGVATVWVEGEPMNDPILDLTFECSDLDKTLTVRAYLKILLATLWTKAEGFSGKRPFGNGGWQFDIYKALLVAGLIDGKLDSDGYVEEADLKAADRLILGAIERM